MSLPHKNRGSFINHKMRTNKKNFCTQLLYKSACLLLSNITRNVRLTLSAINCIYSATPKTVVQQGFFFFFPWGRLYPQTTSVLSFSQISQVDQCSPGPAPAEVF